ncbi:7797_t:CDS:1, partial [Acaulospora colombiana]
MSDQKQARHNMFNSLILGAKRKGKSREKNEEALEGSEKKKKCMIIPPADSENFEIFFDRSRKSGNTSLRASDVSVLIYQPLAWEEPERAS